MHDKAGADYKSGQLAARLLEEAEDILSGQEQKIIKQVVAKLNSGEVLDPQFAIQQWLELYSVHRFRRVLAQKDRSGRSAAAVLTRGVERLAPLNENVE